MSVPGIVSDEIFCFDKFNIFGLLQRCDDHRRKWDTREYEKKASDRIENLRSVKKKPNADDDSDEDDDEETRQQKSVEKKIARTLLQAREFKVC